MHVMPQAELAGPSKAEQSRAEQRADQNGALLRPTDLQVREGVVLGYHPQPDLQRERGMGRAEQAGRAKSEGQKVGAGERREQGKGK